MIIINYDNKTGTNDYNQLKLFEKRIHYFWINHSLLGFRQTIRLQSSYNVQYYNKRIIVILNILPGDRNYSN